MMRSMDDKTPPQISVVIPSYNRKEGMLALLADIFRQEEVAFEVIVVDDCSTDGSADAIEKLFPQVTLFRNKTNGGPCVARNHGIKASRCEYIVGFDSDVTVPDPRLFSKVLTAFSENPQVAGFAFRLLKPDRVTDDAGRWWHPVPIQTFAARSFETNYFSGTACAFRRAPLMEAGLYPEWLYMHYEEVVLAYRLLDGGLKLVYRPELAVIHHSNPVSRRGMIEKYFKPRNQLLVAAACLPLWSAIAYAIPHAGFQFIKALRHNSIVSWIKAMMDGVRKINRREFARAPIKPLTIRRMKLLRRQCQS
jgi:hypothetical protein